MSHLPRHPSAAATLAALCGALAVAMLATGCASTKPDPVRVVFGLRTADRPGRHRRRRSRWACSPTGPGPSPAPVTALEQGRKLFWDATRTPRRGLRPHRSSSWSRTTATSAAGGHRYAQVKDDVLALDELLGSPRSPR